MTQLTDKLYRNSSGCIKEVLYALVPQTFLRFGYAQATTGIGEALKASLKALNGTRIAPDDSTVLELKESIRRSIAVTEKLLKEHSRPVHLITSQRAA